MASSAYTFVSSDGKHVKTRMAELEGEYPDYCFVGEAAKILGLSKRSVHRNHIEKLERIEVDGITLFKRDAVRSYALKRKSHAGGYSRLTVYGIDVERLRKICEVYYRTHYDDAPPHLLKLAKRVAKL